MAVTGTARIFGLLGSLVRTIASIIGGLILVHAVFVLFGANTHNVLVQFTAGIRDSFGWFTKNLFQPSDHTMGEAINDALAGFIWVFPLTFVANTFAPTSTMPTWLRTIAEWNPVSSLTQSLRELWGNGPAAPASAAWPLQHAEITSIVWSVLIAAVFAPLAVAAFRHRSRD